MQAGQRSSRTDMAACDRLAPAISRRSTGVGNARMNRPRQVHRSAVADGRVPASQPSVKIRPDDSVAPVLSGAQVEEAAMRRCIERHERNSNCNVSRNWSYPPDKLEEAYQFCGKVTEHFAKTFYLGTQLMTPEKARATWAIYLWCRRTDELVDGPNADRITPQALDKWESRLEDIFDGKPTDHLDAALTDTVNRFPVDIQPFRDMIDGMRSDIVKTRYQTYDELYEYCYRVAGTVALMVMPVMGVDPKYKGDLEPVYRAALALGTANQLTNILRDVGEDIKERNRVYVPLDDLAKFNITEEELLGGMHSTTTGKMDDRYVQFMKYMINKTMRYYESAEPGIAHLDPAARWPVWSALIVYRKILDAVETNGYDNISKRAYVSKPKKMALLPFSWLCANLPNQAGQISKAVRF
nr:phytoene synthase [Ulva prolifera]